MKYQTFQRRIVGFLLLEVMVAVVVLGVALVGLMKGFVITLDQVSKIRENEEVILMAKSMMDDLVLDPPDTGRYEGGFGDDPRFGERFDRWTWEVEIEDVEPRYEERPKGTIAVELEHYYTASIKIYRDGNSRDGRLMLALNTILVEPDIFSPQALQQNQLF